MADQAQVTAPSPGFAARLKVLAEQPKPTDPAPGPAPLHEDERAMLKDAGVWPASPTVQDRDEVDAPEPDA